MPEHIAGKTFYTSEEAKSRGMRLYTDEELAEINRKFDTWQAERDANPDPDAFVPYGGRFSDDLVGTEYDPDAPGYPEHKRRTFNPREAGDE
ncbi:hypothetical protein [Nocardia sp. NPDC024068]|uniref:hypothetical protein n=1 Tax=Nocardia sp. NPDC024068 TaxID=3157197 RepID=UPI0033FFEB03